MYNHIPPFTTLYPSLSFLTISLFDGSKHVTGVPIVSPRCLDRIHIQVMYIIIIYIIGLMHTCIECCTDTVFEIQFWCLYSDFLDNMMVTIPTPYQYLFPRGDNIIQSINSQMISLLIIQLAGCRQQLQCDTLLLGHTKLQLNMFFAMYSVNSSMTGRYDDRTQHC